MDKQTERIMGRFVIAIIVVGLLAFGGAVYCLWWLISAVLQLIGVGG